MTTERIARTGFVSRGDGLQRRCGLLVQLIATLGLVISLAVAGTAVTIGMAGAAGISVSKR